MNFIDAIKEMEKGKQIKRKGDFQLLDIYNKYSVDEIRATDWEVVEENNTLSDKIDINSSRCRRYWHRMLHQPKGVKIGC